MDLYSLPDLKCIYAHLHQEDLLTCMEECRARRLALHSGGFRRLIGAMLIVTGRAVVRLGELLSGASPAAHRG